MAYDDKLAARLHRILGDRPGITEKKMFGGLAFMLGGNMCCGIVDDRLMLRLGHDRAAAALAEPHTAEMDFTGRVIRTMVYVDGEGIASDDALAGWVERAVAFAANANRARNAKTRSIGRSIAGRPKR